MTVYYISPSGSDANDGSSSAPFLHIQTGVNAAQLSGVSCSVQMADGTYTESVAMAGAAAKSDQIPIAGNQQHPENVIWNAPAGQTCLNVQDLAISTVSGMKLGAPNGGGCISSRQHSVVDIQNVIFGAATVHLSANVNAVINAIGDYSIIGSASTHAEASYSGVVLLNGRAVSMPNALTFTYFLRAGPNSTVGCGGATFSGAGSGTGSSGGQGYTANWGASIWRDGSTIPGTTGFTGNGQVF